MLPSFDFRFSEINLFPSFKGSDGRMHNYGALVSGKACIEYAGDDWRVVELSVETDQSRAMSWGASFEWVHREFKPADEGYELIRQAIYRECHEAIKDALSEARAGQLIAAE